MSETRQEKLDREFDEHMAREAVTTGHRREGKPVGAGEAGVTCMRVYLGVEVWQCVRYLKRIKKNRGPW